MGRSYFGCRLIQFGCRQVTRRRCLVDHWKFKIEALLLSCTPPSQLCTDVSWCPTSCSSMSERRRGCESLTLQPHNPQVHTQPRTPSTFATKQAFREVMRANRAAHSHAHVFTSKHISRCMVTQPHLDTLTCAHTPTQGTFGSCSRCVWGLTGLGGVCPVQAVRSKDCHQHQ